MSSNIFGQISSNPTKYRMFLNYDNDKKVYVLPVLPEKITLTVNGKLTSIDIDTFGEIVHRGKRDAITVEFECFFPPSYGKNYCSCLQKEFKQPAVWHRWMLALLNAKDPFHFVLVGSPLSINMYADLVSYVPYEKGGDVGTIYYKLKLKEHRKPTLCTYKKKQQDKPPRREETGKRPGNNSTVKYKVIAHSGLHLRTGPNAKIIALMPYGKTVTADGKKKGNWYHVKYGSKWGYSYKSWLKKI